MKLASSEARNSAALAVSQAVPILPRSGTRALRASRTAAVDKPVACAIPVMATGVRGQRGDVDDRSGALLAHDRHGVLDGHPGGFEIDGEDAVKGRLIGPMGGPVAATADTDVVDQDVDPSPARLRLGDHGSAAGVARDVRLKGTGAAAFL